MEPLQNIPNFQSKSNLTSPSFVQNFICPLNNTTTDYKSKSNRDQLTPHAYHSQCFVEAKIEYPWYPVGSKSSNTISKM